MPHRVTAGILAGGASGRMGTNKALLPFRGKPLLARQLDVLRPIFERVILGANDAAPYLEFGLDVVPDLLTERCSLTGIHALLSAARTDRVFVFACDLPFLNARLIEDLLARSEGAVDAVVPESDAGPEPLHAVYARSCLPAIEACAARGEWKATAFHRGLKVVVPRIRDAGWAVEGRSPFLNVNTPEEFGRAVP